MANRSFSFSLFFLLVFFSQFVFYPGQIVQASSEDNIDSFDVHPANRWDVTAGSVSAIVEQGYFNISDVGDGTTDSYTLNRDLRDLAGIIQYRFLVNTNSTSGAYEDRFYLVLEEADGNHVFELRTHYVDISNVDTRLLYYGTDGSNEFIYLNSDEDLVYNTWYRLRIDYNVYLSELRIRLYFDNDTKVWDFEWMDFGAETNLPELFSVDTLTLSIYTSIYTDGTYQEFLLDYVDAPFKEQEWVQNASPSDGDWLQDIWSYQEIQDDIDDASKWKLTVPRLDSISTVVSMEVDTVGSFINGDTAAYEFELYCVDADDGDKHIAVKYMMYWYTIGGVTKSYSLLYLDGVLEYTNGGLTVTTDPRVEFVIGTSDDRSIINFRGRFYRDRDDTSNPLYDDFGGSIAVSSVAADPSQEFVIQQYYNMNFDGNVNVKVMVEDFDFTARDIWADLGLAMDLANAATGGVLDDIFGFFFIPIQWLANILSGVLDILGDLLVIAIEAMEATIDAALAAVEAAVEALDPIIQAVQTAVEAIIQDFIDAMNDLVDAAFDFLITAYALIEDLGFAIWNGATGSFDLLAVIDLLWSNFVTTVAKIPAGFNDVLSYVNFWADWIAGFLVLLIILYCLMNSSGDVFGFFAAFMDLMQKNINPGKGALPVVGVHVPFFLFIPFIMLSFGWSA